MDGTPVCIRHGSSRDGTRPKQTRVPSRLDLLPRVIPTKENGKESNMYREDSWRLRVITNNMNRSAQQQEEEKRSSSSEGSQEEQDNESYQGITILASLSSSLNDSDDVAETRLSYQQPLLHPLFPPPDDDDDDEDANNDRVVEQYDEIGTIKSDGSLSLTPSMVIPTTLRVPTTRPKVEQGGTTTMRSLSPASRTIRNDSHHSQHNQTDTGTHNVSFRHILLVVVVSVVTGFLLGFRAGQHASQAQQEQLLALYLQEVQEIMAQKEAQIQELVIQKQNRALVWEIVRAGSIALASSVAQIAAGPLTDYFLTDVVVDTK